VNHDGPLVRASLVDKLELEALGHLEVQLNRSHLVRPAERVVNGQVNFRTVKRAVARVQSPLAARQRFTQRRLGLRPLLVRAATRRVRVSVSFSVV